MSKLEYDSIILPGDITLKPSSFTNYIRFHILNECSRKYNGSIIEIEGNHGIITRVKNIKDKSIVSKNNRNSNVSSMRFYFDMVVSIYFPTENSKIDCTVTSIHNEYIEASINSAENVVVLIFIAENHINHDQLMIKDDKIIDRESSQPLKINSSISCICNTIIPSQPQLIIFGKIIEIYKE